MHLIFLNFFYHILDGHMHIFFLNKDTGKNNVYTRNIYTKNNFIDFKIYPFILFFFNFNSFDERIKTLLYYYLFIYLFDIC